MGLFEHFPYVNFHQANIDWVLERVRYFETQLTAFSERLTTAEGNITDLQSAVSDLQTALSDLETALQNQIDSLDGRLDTAEDDIDLLEGHMESAEHDIDKLEEQMARTRTSQLDTDLSTAEGEIDTLQDQMAGTESSGLLDLIHANALPSYTGLDWDSALRIVDIGGGVYRAVWHEPAVVSFATGNISATNLTSPTITALRTGNTVQIDLEGEVTATDDVVITVGKYRPVGSAGSALPWQIPAVVNEITHATTTYEIDNSGDLIITIFNLTASDAVGLHLVYITDEPIEQPA